MSSAIWGAGLSHTACNKVSVTAKKVSVSSCRSCAVCNYLRQAAELNPLCPHRFLQCPLLHVHIASMLPTVALHVFSHFASMIFAPYFCFLFFSTVMCYMFNKLEFYLFTVFWGGRCVLMKFCLQQLYCRYTWCNCVERMWMLFWAQMYFRSEPLGDPTGFFPYFCLCKLRVVPFSPLTVL